MSAIVRTTYGSGFVKLAEADEWHIDSGGNLQMMTGRCGQVAAFAAGKWNEVRMIPNRGRDGRFVKRDSK